MNNAEPMKLVKSAIRTMQLFSLFAERKCPLSLAEVSESMRAPKSSCFELIQTLIYLGYLIAIDGGKMYYPSRRLYEMAGQINQFNPIKEKVQSELRRLRDLTGETVLIGRLQGGQVVYSEVFDGVHAVRYSASSGDLKAVHASALGKALLASLDEDAQSALITDLRLTRFTEKTITKKRDLKENLSQCAKQGIYTAIGEHIAEVMGLAIPVKIQGHQLAIGLAGPIPRVQKSLKSYSLALKEAAGVVAG